MSEYEPGSCVILGKPHQADDGMHTCRYHLERLAAMLRDVEDEAAMLSPVPSLQQRNGGGGTLASQRAPARLAVLVHTDRRRGTGKSETDDDALAAGDTLPILDVLGSWARIVREERQLASPEQVTVSSERETLTRHLSWMCRQPWIDEAYDDVRALLTQLKGVNGTGADKPYSTCPVITDGQPCTGQVWVQDELQLVWRRYADRCSKAWEQAPGAAACDACGAVWKTEADKARLKRMVDDAATELTRPWTEDGRPMRTAVELAQDLGMSVPAVRMRLSRVGARAVHGSYYDPAMVERETA